ncbi:GGDEF domain-containing protein [Undibacterium sp.]|jgi:diguanylate cyclase (GGDEF)-like protein|uniref:GGDEF domain-containing protein n=1 Tax=Undibacterium sp. TaxID=1914977 RepID=UPI002BC29635|nr:GGDEF domain-containing protein [Undibacterium sp.]HTD04313.1 GGDEF domain-containing protein [Undibacterium sp.]
MESIIKHLVEITGHRDHDLLNISVISALGELTHAEYARALDVVAVGKQIFVQPQITIKNGKVVTVDEHLAALQTGEAVSQYPALEQGLAQHSNLIEDLTEDGKRILWLPIWINDKVSTCLEITNPASYTQNTMEVMEGILIVYRNFQNLLDYSERDSLTGLLNRKTFDDSFSKVLRATSQQNNGEGENDEGSSAERRHHEPEKQHWLAVLDIDHFKRVNDQFGHLYGDEVLILIANLLRSSFRPTDRLFRFGGEEFVILLRSTTQEDAQHIFDRFRVNVEQHHFPQVGKVTVSVGFARIDPFEPAVAIMGRADQALYFAKSNGRNRTCYYDSLVESGDLHAERSNDTAEFF